MIRPHGHSATLRKSGERIPHNMALDVAADGTVLRPDVNGWLSPLLCYWEGKER